MNQPQRLAFILPLVLISACVSMTPPVPNPGPTPAPEPGPTPAPGIAYEGEWVVTFTPDEGEEFTHALQITADVSADGLTNAGGGLQELCADACGETQADGFGFIGDLLLSDGTTVGALAIFTQTSAPGSTSLKTFTVEPIRLTTDEDGQATLTSVAAWIDRDNEVVKGTLTATNIGEPRELDGFGLINIGEAIEMLREAAYY